MILAHRIQLEPTADQANAFARACGCARVAWNWALAEYKRELEAGGKPKLPLLKKKWNALKKSEFPWIYESPKDANQQPFTNLKKAFQQFYKKKARFPRFKRKGVRDSFYVSNDKFSLTGDKVRLPLIGEVRMTEELRFSGKIMAGTVSREADRWFLAVQVEVGAYKKPRTGDKTVGLDFGLKTAVTTSEGQKIEAPLPFSRNLDRLRRRSRQLSRKQKGSNNCKKARTRLSRLHYRISCIRKDWQHKLTARLCRENQTIVIEDLSIDGMMRLWGRKTADVGLFELRRQLEYKSLIYGTALVTASRWFPSTKLCYQCGQLNSLTLRDREYRCDCGHVEDRDVNAAKNLSRLGYSRSNACGEVGAGVPVTARETDLVEAGTDQVMDSRSLT